MTIITTLPADMSRVTSVLNNSLIINKKTEIVFALEEYIKTAKNSVYGFVSALKKTRADQIFEDIVPGDIVTAVRPWSRNEFTKIRISDRLESYVIVNKTDDGIVVYPCSSKASDDKAATVFQTSADTEQIILNKAYFISKKRVHDHTDHISTKDQLRMNMIMNRSEISFENSPRFNVRLQIRYNAVLNKGMDYYYVFTLDGDTADVFRMTKEKTEQPVNFMNTLWYVDCSEKMHIQLDDTYAPVGELTSNVHSSIAYILKTEKIKKKQQERNARCIKYGRRKNSNAVVTG